MFTEIAQIPARYGVQPLVYCSGQGKTDMQCNPSVTGGTFWVEERTGVLMDIQWETAQHPVEVADHIDLAFLQGVAD